MSRTRDIVKSARTKGTWLNKKVVGKRGKYVAYPLPFVLRQVDSTDIIRDLKKLGVRSRFVAGNVLMLKADLRKTSKKRKKK